jgi:hypothetical protein
MPGLRDIGRRAAGQAASARPSARPARRALLSGPLRYSGAMNPGRPRPRPAVLSLAALLAACGVEEANAMTKFADQMCACKDVACAEKLFPEIEKLANANEGKEVVAAVADKYNAEMDRAQKCYEKVHTDAEAAEAAKPAEAK